MITQSPAGIFIQWTEPRKFKRSLQDRSKYQPHQGKRERERRMQQVWNVQLEMAGARDLRDVLVERYNELFKENAA